jgi:hypothetical protein
MRSTRTKTAILHTSIAMLAIYLLSQPIQSSFPNEVTNVYAEEMPSDSIPFCEDPRLPIHSYCTNLDSQIPPRGEALKQWSIEMAEAMLTRIDK